MKHLQLLPKEDRRLLRGHPWVYRNELAKIPPMDDGELADVFSAQDRFIGRGFYQAQGGIAVRLLTRHQVPIDGVFLNERIDNARIFRERLFPDQSVYRWVFGESDGLPGFVADRYGTLISAQTSCRFYASCVDELADAFLAREGVEGVRIVINNVLHTYGNAPASVIASIDGVQVAVNLEEGQKTGMFLDQRENCLAIRRFAHNARVLDGHCYIGLWSCHAALAGAKSVLGVDTSAKAIEAATANAQRNGVGDQCAFERADIAEVLQQRGDRYDVVLLDPPAFVKSHAQEHKALGLYQALNAAAMNAVEPGGILVTSSCSHFVSREAFLEVLKRAASAAHRKVWAFDVRGAAPDHPVLLAMPETAYLKCVFLRVL